MTGLVLSGGRGKGVATEHSDWDAVLVVTDNAVDEWLSYDFGALDMTVLSDSAFAEYAEPGGPDSWRRYDFAYLDSAVDRRGFGEALRRKGRLTDALARDIAERSVDATLNGLYRAAKNDRDGNRVGALLDLAGMPWPYLEAQFAIDGRLHPYNKFLAWELERRPLRHRSIDTAQMLSLLTTLPSDTGIEAAWELCEVLATACRSAGVTKALDGWEDHLIALRPDWAAASKDAD